MQQADAKLAFLKSVWPNVKDQMALVEVNYVEADGVIRKAQQNTYAPPLLTALGHVARPLTFPWRRLSVTTPRCSRRTLSLDRTM